VEKKSADNKTGKNSPCHSRAYCRKWAYQTGLHEHCVRAFKVSLISLDQSESNPRYCNSHNAIWWPLLYYKHRCLYNKNAAISV